MTDYKKDILAYTATIVAGYAARKDISDLPQLLREVYKAVEGFHRDIQKGVSGTPAVSVKDSVTPDYIVCLEDGKKLKMLKRYLKATYDMSPEEYRQKWNLPEDYPMTAPNYAKRRSRLAKEIGLGTATNKK